MDLQFHEVTIPMADLSQLNYSAGTRTLYIQPYSKALRGIMELLNKKEENYTEHMGILAVKQVDTFYIQ